MSRMSNKEFKQLLTEWTRKIINESDAANLKGERQKLEFVKNANPSSTQDRKTLAVLSQDKSGEVRKAAASTQGLNAEQLAKYFSDERNEAGDLTSVFSANRENFNTAVLDHIFDAVKKSKTLAYLSNVFATHEDTSEDVLEELAEIGIKNSSSILLRKILGNRNCPSYVKKKIQSSIKDMK